MKDKITFAVCGSIMIIGGVALGKEITSINKTYKEDKQILEAIFKYINDNK